MDVEIVSAVFAADGVPSEARSEPHGAIDVFWADIAKQMEGSHFFEEHCTYSMAIASKDLESAPKWS